MTRARPILHGVTLFLLLAAAGPLTAQQSGPTAGAPTPIQLGESFTIESAALAETRRINVYRPPAWGEEADAPRPVLYMPDGGIGEDFVHVAGLLQVSVMNGSMRPFLLVGIENTERRRDLTGPTTVASDREIAPRVGGGAAFRAFIRDELMPAVDSRYATTSETAIVGESLAGLFIVETYLLEPELFDTYVAFDPSLWWNGGALVDRASSGGLTASHTGRTLYLASSGQQELAALALRLAGALTARGATVVYQPMPAETHATIYHPAALRAFRQLFAPTN